MTCPEARERLTDHLLGESAAPEAAGVQAHIATCTACGEEAQRLRDTIALLQAHAPSAPTELEGARKREIDEAARRPRRTAFLPFAAAAATIVVSGLLAWRVQRASEVPAAFHFQTSPPSPTAAVRDADEPDLERQVKRELVERKAQLEVVRAEAEEKAKTQAKNKRPNPVVAFAEGLSALGYIEHDYATRADDSLASSMFFEHQGTNPFVRTDEDHRSTFGLDVDTASYTIVRNYLLRGELPPASAVRVEEFVNAFPHAYAPPREGTFAIHAQGVPHPFRRGQHLLRIGLKARESHGRERKPAVLTFVIDVSGSMAQENRLGLVKRSLELLVDRLDRRDSIGIVVYGTSGRVVLPPTSVGRDRPLILQAIRGLHPEGSTNLEEGLDLGYEMAAQHFREGASNRVVLCTDGVANNGVSRAEGLLRQIGHRARAGIDLMALGFGMGNYNDALLQKLADRGNGQYAYIDDFGEAEAFFLRDLTSILEVVARDAKAQVAFDPSRVKRYRLLGYEKREVADRDFRNDEVDGGEVNAGHAVTVLYELELESEGGTIGTVRVRYADPDTGRSEEQSLRLTEAMFMGSFDEAAPELQRDAVVARFAEHLRDSSWIRGEPLARVLQEAERLPRVVRQSPPVVELTGLIRTAIDRRREDARGE